MQKDLDAFLETYNRNRPHQGRGMKGRTPLTVFKAGLAKAPAKEVQNAAKRTSRQEADVRR